MFAYLIVLLVLFSNRWEVIKIQGCLIIQVNEMMYIWFASKDKVAQWYSLLWTTTTGYPPGLSEEHTHN